MSYLEFINENAGKYFREKPTAVSEDISVNSTTLAQKALPLPAGAYVTKIQMFAKYPIASADIDIGTGREADVFLDGVATLPRYHILTAPVPAADQGTNDESGGAYFATATWINVTTGATATRGTLKVFAWYYV